MALAGLILLVTMDLWGVDRRYYNDTAEFAYINIPAGYQQMCGDKALQYARFRGSLVEPERPFRHRVTRAGKCDRQDRQPELDGDAECAIAERQQLTGRRTRPLRQYHHRHILRQTVANALHRIRAAPRIATVDRNVTGHAHQPAHD